MKQCSKCKLFKSLDNFYKHHLTKDGYRPDCKSCRAVSIRQYRSTTSGKDAMRFSEQKRLGTPKRRSSSAMSSRRRRERAFTIELCLSLEDIVSIKDRFQHQCFNCGSKERLEIDHHYPLSKGFGLSSKNAVLLCRLCNSRKGNKFPEEFYDQSQIITLRDLGVAALV